MLTPACLACGAPLTAADGVWRCDDCGSTFADTMVTPPTEPSSTDGEA